MPVIGYKENKDDDDDTLSWKEHILDLTSRLNKSCYTIRVIKSFMTPNVLKTVYFLYFHPVMSYGVIFWSNSHLSNNIFKIQKRSIRIIANSGKYDSCRKLFRQPQIPTLPSQYVFSLLVFVAKNIHLIFLQFWYPRKYTRHNCNLHLPTTNLSLIQKGVLYSGSKAYNDLPTHIKTLSNDLKRFKS
jgi:NADH:ubiquinone oxidoreductase subunit 3 (subunit A)